MTKVTKSLKKPVAETSGDTLLNIILFQFIPYWPLVAILSLAFLSVAFVFTKYITPTYLITATLVIKDKGKGVEESQTLQSLNMYAGGKTVENEVLVLKSRTLMRDVVLNLNLYAPIFEKGNIKPASAYLSSPIIIEAKKPENLKEQTEINFAYNHSTNTVNIGDQSYPLNQWVKLPYGTLRFLRNPFKQLSTTRSLYFSLVDPRKVTDNMLGSLEVAASSKLSSVVNIGFTDEVPRRGENVVNTLIDAYNRASVQNNNQLASNTLTFVSDRVRLLENELDSINRRIQEFKSKEGIVDLSEQGKLYLENVSENDRKASDINMQLAILNQVDQHVRAGGSQTGIVPTTLGIEDPVLTDLLQTLNELELRYASLRRTTGENNPMTEEVESEIQKIRPNILSIVRNQRQRLQASRNNLVSTSNRFNSAISTIPQKERELLEISRQQAIKNDVYAFLQQRREEAELSAASTIADSRIVDRAEASVRPVASKRVLILAGAIIAATAFSIGYVFIKEGLTNKVLFRSDIEKATSIPVVAEIPHIKKLRASKSHLLTNSILSAQFNQLQATIGLFAFGVKNQKVMITSSIKGEGKTLVSNQLAISLAETGQKVLLMDLNLTSPDTSILHQMDDFSGFIDYIKGDSELDEIIYKSNIENLSILPAGGNYNNSTKLLLNSRIQDLFNLVETYYNYIIIDTAPTELTTDAYLLTQYIDLSLYVIRQGKTNKNNLQKFGRNPQIERIPKLSIIFNDIKGRGFLNKYYGYGYGYGYETIPKSNLLKFKKA
ncbi:tyrosine protein kinase [Adhaeribacter aerolatus]|uniref:non-specific protein-tyrosine kinase n=1 Tax=Adhaeribacter aerolatus TaxID=670289 RepID=A0A512B213_9BACT|nr:tyrosine-protein kinase domain-containing protein [Adhaeribacter aerolatus]GEO06005.1 tyrosine protein kinase [Adhaeribacter aerolatus]